MQTSETLQRSLNQFEKDLEEAVARHHKLQHELQLARFDCIMLEPGYLRYSKSKEAKAADRHLEEMLQQVPVNNRIIKRLEQAVITIRHKHRAALQREAAERPKSVARRLGEAQLARTNAKTVVQQLINEQAVQYDSIFYAIQHNDRELLECKQDQLVSTTTELFNAEFKLAQIFKTVNMLKEEQRKMAELLETDLTVYSDVDEFLLKHEPGNAPVDSTCVHPTQPPKEGPLVHHTTHNKWSDPVVSVDVFSNEALDYFEVAWGGNLRASKRGVYRSFSTSNKRYISLHYNAVRTGKFERMG